MARRARTTICIAHPFDPRGKKIGGIESHIREMIRSCPDDIAIVMIGIDEIGDLAIGRMQGASFDGCVFEFLPLLTRRGRAHHGAATRLSQSLTLAFFLAFLRHLTTIRRALRGRCCSLEIERFEYATFGLLLGAPTLQIIHGEFCSRQPIDSMLRKYWIAHWLNERVGILSATRILGVNRAIVSGIGARFPFAAGKTAWMTVSVNTDRFALAPDFPPPAPFRIGFAGRLDGFKRPDLIFRIIDDLRSRHRVDAELHYIGDSDPERFAEFDRVRGHCVRHGSHDAEGVARLLANVHAGILVSGIEGMPVYLLETLAVGRPLAALELPQYRDLIEDGVSGFVVSRGGDDENVARMADALVEIHKAIIAGQFEPAAIRRKVALFSHLTQLPRLFEIHRSLPRPKTTALGWSEAAGFGRPIGP
jgi:glycosyltransferase involved in cell wall biosynthesis